MQIPKIISNPNTELKIINAKVKLIRRVMQINPHISDQYTNFFRYLHRRKIKLPKDILFKILYINASIFYQP